ncbi:MAG: hypothetical protein V1722_04225 [Candidatus Micrarchaeota archaeon]
MPEKTTNGKPQKREVTELHVLVHPHFAIASNFAYPEAVSLAKRETHEFNAVEPRARLKNIAIEMAKPRLAMGLPADNEYVVPKQEVIDRLYRNKIKRISKTPHAVLVILRDEVNVTNKTDSLQESLIKFAHSKLGRRLLVLDSTPHNVASEVQKQLSLPREVPIRVFGEWYDQCVSHATGSMKNAGFTNVKRLKNQSIYRFNLE